MERFQDKPYAKFVEDTIPRMFEVDPRAISMQMRDNYGQTFTCYWNCDCDDLAIIQDALREDHLMEFFRNNREELSSILNGEEEE